MRAKLITLAAALLPLVVPGHASSTDLSSPVGLWQALDDDTKQPTGWFLITDHGGVYDGIIAKMFFKPGENQNSYVRRVQRRSSRPSVARARNHPRHETGRRCQIWRRNDSRSARRQNLSRDDEDLAGWRHADGARLYRHRAVGSKSILDALAGFRLQPARSVRQSEYGSHHQSSRQASCSAAAQTIWSDDWPDDRAGRS